MRVVVIGGTGHIGSYLVPRLVGRGYETVCVSRRQRQPYVADERWAMVNHAVIDRPAEEQRGQFGDRIAELRPNVVIDLTCYALDSAVQLSNAVPRQYCVRPKIIDVGVAGQHSTDDASRHHDGGCGPIGASDASRSPARDSRPAPPARRSRSFEEALSPS